MAVLVADNLTRSFGQGTNRRTVLGGVSLSLERGQFILLMGPSGSGKSTLLALLSGLSRPETGRVQILGQDLWGMTERQRERFRLRHFGFIFQGYNLFPSLTAQEQLEMVLRWGEGVSHAEAARRVNAILDDLGLADRSDLRPGQLSGGEKQRVAVARALVKNPELCFADEPTSALDWAAGKQVVAMLQQATHRFNTLMFVVAHDTRLIPYADRVFHLDEGLLVETVPHGIPGGDAPS
ncbi:MAG: ABC transporter ATP-binding protein [Gemmataceae bacterium]